MNSKTRILGIAPYASMKSAMIRVANDRNDIELTVEVGEIEAGAEIAKRYEDEDFDAILSRGGTKLEIQKVTSKPVFDIPISHFDLLNIIKLVENYRGKVAIIAYSNIAKSAKVLCELLHYNYDVFVIDSYSASREKVQVLKEQGYTLIIGDTVSAAHAEEQGIQSMLLISGPESIREAFDNVVNVCNYFSRLKMEDAFFKAFVRSREAMIIVMDENGTVVFSTCTNEKKPLLTFCRNMIPSIRVGETAIAHKKLSDGLFMISGNKSRMMGATYYFFDIQKSKLNLTYLSGFQSIKVCNYDDLVEQDSENLFYSRNNRHTIWKQCNTIAKAKTAVLIIGEPGSEKEKLACQLYLDSESVHNPFYIVNCATLSEKELDYLLNNEKSPIYSLRGTVLFKGVHILADSLFEKLLDGLQSMAQMLHSRMLFTYEVRSAHTDEKQDLYRCDAARTRVGCVEIKIPPLRDCVEDIANLSVLYIHQQNRINGTQIVGLEPAAVSILEEYAWPQNINQLQRVLNEAMLATDSPWITAKSIRQILSTEKLAGVSHGGGTQINIKQPLSGIVYDAAMLVLAEENMNQVKAAKRLGISRTTLWRMLHKERDK